MCGVHCRTFVLREPIALLDLVLRIWTWSYASGLGLTHLDLVLRIWTWSYVSGLGPTHLDLVLRIWTWSYAGPPCILCVALLHCICVLSIDVFVCVCVRVCSVHVCCALAFGFVTSCVSDLYKLLCTVYSVLFVASERWDCFVFQCYTCLFTVKLNVLYFGLKRSVTMFSAARLLSCFLILFWPHDPALPTTLHTNTHTHTHTHTHTDTHTHTSTTYLSVCQSVWLSLSVLCVYLSVCAVFQNDYGAHASEMTSRTTWLPPFAPVL